MYEVDREALENLDKLEAHPVWYERTPCPIIPAEGQEKDEVLCDIYCLTKPKSDLRKLPFLCAYTKDHIANYVPAPLRSNPGSLREQSQGE